MGNLIYVKLLYIQTMQPSCKQLCVEMLDQCTALVLWKFDKLAAGIQPIKNTLKLSGVASMGAHTLVQGGHYPLENANLFF